MERDFFSEPVATEQEAVVLHWKVLSLHWTQWQNFYVVGGEPLDAPSLEVLIVKFGWDFEQPVLWKVFLSPWQRDLVWSLNISSNPNLSIIGKHLFMKHQICIAYCSISQFCFGSSCHVSFLMLLHVYFSLIISPTKRVNSPHKTRADLFQP